ncbi:MAG TPA: serine/threonine-protein kinase [Microlunatus sp.]
MIDQVIGAGRYRVGRTLARGGMAHVRLGLDVRTGQAVAVKYLNAEFLREENARRLFEAEATTAGLDHPGVVRVLDSGDAEDHGTGVSVPYIVMEFVPGESMSTLLRRDGAVGPDAALDLTVQLLEALSYCHAAGLVHCDIKPSNVMVTPSGRVKLVDFGVARHVCDTSEQLDGASRFVTTAYASPEQAQRSPTDSRSDLYSVGCVLYELLTGRPPFVGEAQDVLFERLVDEPRAPSEHNPQVSPELDAVVLRSLRRDPGDRHPSAEAMKNDLDDVVRFRRAPACPSPVPSRDVTHAAGSGWPAVTVLRPARRRRTVRLISGVAAALLPVAGFGVVHLRGAEPMDGAAMALSLGGVSEGTSAAGGSGSAAGSPILALRSTASTGIDQSCELSAKGVTVPARVAVEGAAVANAVTMLGSAGGNRPGAAVDSTRSSTRQMSTTSQPRQRERSAEPIRPKPVPAEPAKPAEPVKPEPTKPDRPKPVPSKPVPKPDKPKPDKPKPSKPKPSKPDKVKTPKPDKPKSTSDRSAPTDTAIG